MVGENAIDVYSLDADALAGDRRRDRRADARRAGHADRRGARRGEHPRVPLRGPAAGADHTHGRGCTMTKTAIISVDGHVKASPAGYRDYVDQYLDAYDDWVRAERGTPDAGNCNPIRSESQWDSDRRWPTSRPRASWPRSCSRTVCRSRSAGSKTPGRPMDPELTDRRARPTTVGSPTSCAEPPGGSPARRSCRSTTSTRR